jgi:hypothetical protein
LNYKIRFQWIWPITNIHSCYTVNNHQIKSTQHNNTMHYNSQCYSSYVLCKVNTGKWIKYSDTCVNWTSLGSTFVFIIDRYFRFIQVKLTNIFNIMTLFEVYSGFGLDRLHCNSIPEPPKTSRFLLFQSWSLFRGSSVTVYYDNEYKGMLCSTLGALIFFEMNVLRAFGEMLTDFLHLLWVLR